MVRWSLNKLHSSPTQGQSSVKYITICYGSDYLCKEYKGEAVEAVRIYLASKMTNKEQGYFGKGKITRLLKMDRKAEKMYFRANASRPRGVNQ